jgi:hypothetical protein
LTRAARTTTANRRAAARIVFSLPGLPRDRPGGAPTLTGVKRSNAPAPPAAWGFLGVAVDEQLNRAVQLDTDISSVDAQVRTVVVAAREDLQIAAETQRLLATDGSLDPTTSGRWS